MFISVILFGIFVYGYWGTQIADVSQDIAMAIYEAEWYNWKVEDQKLVLMIIMRAQKGMQMKNAYYMINVPAFGDVSMWLATSCEYIKGFFCLF